MMVPKMGLSAVSRVHTVSMLNTDQNFVFWNVFNVVINVDACHSLIKVELIGSPEFGWLW